jgi:hypothetical protein
MPKSKDNSLTGTLTMLETELSKLFSHKQIPSLPESLKELIVKLSPWLAVIGVLVLAPLLLAALGISAVAYPMAYVAGTRLGFSYTIGLILSVGMLILEAMAIPGLFKREQKAWKLMFYATLLSLLQSLFNWNLGSLVIGGAISFYFLFQVKAKYTK